MLAEPGQPGLTHYVDGAWATPCGGDTVAITNPATEELVAHVPRGTVADVEPAILAARRAFDTGPWPRMSRRDRGSILRGFADALWRNRDKIVDIAIAQGGCTYSQRATQVDWPIQTMFRYAELAEGSAVEHISVSGGVFGTGTGHPHGAAGAGVGQTFAVREPVGVVAAITPFNYPFLLNVMKLGPALAAGCTVVLKPTEYVCLDAAEIARIIDEETDLPPGAVNILLGSAGPDVGEAMISHPAVDLISFTGSTATGRRIMAAAAPTIKKLSLELGGKSANVIFADADLDRALAGDCALVIRHCGQACSHLSRVLVEDAIHDEVVERMLARARTVVVGDPTDPTTEMGPLVSQAQWDRVKGYIDSGLEEGAALAIGGERPPDQPRGFFMEPTVLTDVRADMRVFQEEIFGPVVVVQRFHSEEEAVALANATIYGLNGAVWSGDLARGLNVAGRMRAGTVSVNGAGSDNWEAPYGGYKQSGIGRDFGAWAVEEFTEIKTLRYTSY
jgi:aldehyde dehydrogenase (NAD+)